MEIAGIVLGTVLIGLFVYSNLYLDGLWATFAPRNALNGKASVHGAVRGTFEAVLFMVGVALVTASIAAVGISLGYGGF